MVPSTPLSPGGRSTTTRRNPRKEQKSEHVLMHTVHFSCTLTSSYCVSTLHLYTHQLLLCLISSLVRSPAATVSHLFTCTLTSWYCVSTLHLYAHQLLLCLHSSLVLMHVHVLHVRMYRLRLPFNSDRTCQPSYPKKQHLWNKERAASCYRYCMSTDVSPSSRHFLFAW